MRKYIKQLCFILGAIYYFPFVFILYIIVCLFDILLIPWVFLAKKAWMDDEYFYFMHKIWD